MVKLDDEVTDALVMRVAELNVLLSRIEWKMQELYLPLIIIHERFTFPVSEKFSFDESCTSKPLVGEDVAANTASAL